MSGNKLPMAVKQAKTIGQFYTFFWNIFAATTLSEAMREAGDELELPETSHYMLYLNIVLQREKHEHAWGIANLAS
jgi:hypothetical protein